MPLSWNEIQSRAIGNYYVHLPLSKSVTIVPDNAVRTDWQNLIDPLPWQKGMPKYDYILGNPTFIGRSLMNAAQKAGIDITFNGVNAAGVLYIKGVNYMQEYNFMEPAEGSSIKQPLRRTLVQDKTGQQQADYNNRISSICNNQNDSSF